MDSKSFLVTAAGEGGHVSISGTGGGAAAANSEHINFPTSPAHSSPSPARRIPSSSAVVPLSKADYMQKRSLAYLLAVGNLISAFFYLAFYKMGQFSNSHAHELKENLREPWTVYRWLGSKGVDVTDLQWYYFVVALPPIAPYLLLFLYVSHRLRRYIASQPGAWVRGAANSAVEQRSSTVKASVEVVPPPAFAAGRNERAPEREKSIELSMSGGESPRSQNRLLPSMSIVLSRKNTTPLHVFHIFSGAFIAFVLSGPGFLFGLALMSLNFFLIAPLYKRHTFRVCMAVMWATHIAVLFINFHAGGYKFAWFGLSFLDNLFTPLIRWNVQYNMTILRMISFNNDLWESVICGEEQRAKSLDKHERTCVACAKIRDENRQAALTLPREAVSCYKCRTECSRRIEEFTFSAYLGYIFYLPLFMAGPLSSFNAYVSYLHYPQRSMIGAAKWRYGLRWLGHAVMLSTLMHYVYTMAILLTPIHVVAAAAGNATTTTTATTAAPVRAVWMLLDQLSPLSITATTTTTSTTTTTTLSPGGTPGVTSLLDVLSLSQKSVLFFLVLTFLWAKFDVIWRFFRLFAMMDGMDPPEDMPRCFANSVNIQSFWRDWHASFNLWIVRYMYIPMGGSRTKFLSIFPIFFFIAIWHDIEMRLLYWAFFICIGMIPELVITTFFASRTNWFVLRVKRRRLLWRWMRIIGSQLCLMELTLVNLVGFAIGTSGTEEGLRDVGRFMTPVYLIYTPSLFLSAGVLSIQDRDQRAYEENQLKIKFGLQ